MTSHQGSQKPTCAPVPEALNDAVFQDLLNTRGRRLLALCRHLERTALNSNILTRPLLGELLSQAAMLEELLDAYGARRNQRWFCLRHLVAVTKSFANSSYILLHIQHTQKHYRLLEVEGDVAEMTEQAILFNSNVLMGLATGLIREAKNLGLTLPDDPYDDDNFAETLPAGRLENNRRCRHVDSAEEAVAKLATAFLNLASESEVLHTPKKVKPEEYKSCIPTPISEEELRQLEEKFHNLQSMYDTWISDTDTEELDTDLPFLRGHVSVIYHLLQVGTAYVHHFSRHILGHSASAETVQIGHMVVEPTALLNLLMNFVLTYCSRYLTSARGLCQRMLKRYARIDRIAVSVPKYRGFHVRPSTLVSKIAHHYGSDVQMELGGELYDASAPLDLFRANEAINAQKRRHLAHVISELKVDLPEQAAIDMIDAVRQVITRLAADGQLVIYERPLPLEDLQPTPGETLNQFAVDEIARMLAMGKIDIESEITATFIGDRRVLEDIELLVENGYGEDAFGNNIPLPKKLAYLRR